MSEHTPGPWEAEGNRVTSPLTGPLAVVVAPIGHVSKIEVARANARLIAAAPELLEAAEAAERALAALNIQEGTPGKSRPVVDKLRGVIAKARGD